MPGVQIFTVEAWSRFTHINLFLEGVLTLLNRRNREAMISMANMNTYDKSDSHVLFTFKVDVILLLLDEPILKRKRY